MISHHIPEELLQQLAVEPEAASPGELEHLAGCSSCQETLHAYSTMFKAIGEQVPESFDFDLAALVMQALPAEPRRRPVTSAFILLLALPVLLMTAGALYYLRDYVTLFLYNSQAFFIYVAMISMFTIIIYQCYDMYKNYRRKMKILELS